VITIGEVTGVGWLGKISFVLSMVGLVSLPIAVGIAILRYRLYDIDLLINRTLVYGPLTTTLVLVYLGGIVLLQRVFVVLTGEESTLAVVASTLVIAALFKPLRRRIQSATLRDETNLDALSDDLVGVVGETMQPAHVALWLRPDRASKGEQAE